MAYFRKKPVVIEAFRMGIDEQPDWFRDAVSANTITTHTQRYSNNPSIHWCIIKTLEGRMTGGHGDYIIKGVEGEIYPCKADVFWKTYEPVTKNKFFRQLFCKHNWTLIGTDKWRTDGGMRTVLLRVHRCEKCWKRQSKMKVV